jgi:hypothetical protein
MQEFGEEMPNPLILTEYNNANFMGLEGGEK